jgi:REP element-mobilizing transposase RayT
MGQSLSQLYVHLTFGVKNRHPFIKNEWRTDLHKYVAGILKNLESPALQINSVADHIHILFRLSKNMALAKVVENVKKDSSKWVKTIENVNPNFSWQIGYGAFSVSSSKVDIVTRYIQNQEAHHKRTTYKEELEKFLEEYDVVEYDERYFWR